MAIAFKHVYLDTWTPKHEHPRKPNTSLKVRPREHSKLHCHCGHLPLSGRHFCRMVVSATSVLPTKLSLHRRDNNRIWRIETTISPDQAVVSASFVHHKHGDAIEMLYPTNTAKSQPPYPSTNLGCVAIPVPPVWPTYLRSKYLVCICMPSVQLLAALSRLTPQNASSRHDSRSRGTQ